MNTLFNINELLQTEQSRQFSDYSQRSETSKISRPNLRGTASSKRKAQRALSIAGAAILSVYCGQMQIISEKANPDGTAQIIAQVWEDGENVLYQYDIDENGDYCEIQL